MRYFDSYELTYKNALENNLNLENRPHSLIQFLENDVIPRLDLTEDGDWNALDVGCGPRSVFEYIKTPPFKVKGVDISKSAIEMAKRNDSEIDYEKADITELTALNQYDLIVDGHCLHCIVEEKERKKALKNIYNALKPNGLFAIETMTEHKRMEFEDHFFFNKDNKVLYRFDTNINFDDQIFHNGRPFIPTRMIKHAMEIESEILEMGFQIIFLYVFSNRKIIPDEKRTHPLPSDPDLLRMICKKPS